MKGSREARENAHVPLVETVCQRGHVYLLTKCVFLRPKCTAGADERWRMDRTVQETTADRQLHVSPVCHTNSEVCHATPEDQARLSACIRCDQLAIKHMGLPSYVHPASGLLTLCDNDVISFVDSNAWLLGCCRPLCAVCAGNFVAGHALFRPGAAGGGEAENVG